MGSTYTNTMHTLKPWKIALQTRRQYLSKNDRFIANVEIGLNGIFLSKKIIVQQMPFKSQIFKVSKTDMKFKRSDYHNTNCSFLSLHSNSQM